MKDKIKFPDRHKNLLKRSISYLPMNNRSTIDRTKRIHNLTLLWWDENEISFVDNF